MRYLTNELAKLLGVATNTIRRYEDSGFLKPTRDKANYRYYQKFDIIKLAMIRLFIKCGFSHEIYARKHKGQHTQYLRRKAE